MYASLQKVGSTIAGAHILAALVLAGPNVSHAQSQVRGSATMTIAPVLRIREVKSTVPRVVRPGVVEVTHDLETAANVDYVVAVRSAGAAGSGQTSGGLRISVRTPEGKLVPIEQGRSASAARGSRGAHGQATVTLRIEGAGAMIAANSSSLVDFELKADGN